MFRATTGITILGILTATLAWQASAPAQEDTARPRPAATSRPMRRGQGPGQRRQLSTEEIEKIVAFAKKHLPEMGRRLEELLKDNPRRAMSPLHNVRRLQEYLSRYPDDVREAALKSWLIQMELFKLRAEHNRANDEKTKARLKESMRRLLEEKFDYDQAVRAQDIIRHAKHVEDLTTDLKRPRSQRKQAVAVKLAELLKPPGRIGRGSTTRPAVQHRRDPRPGGALQSPPAGRSERLGPNDGMGRRRRGRRWRRRPLTDDEIQELLAFAKEHMPAGIHAQVVKMLKTDRRKAEPLLRYIKSIHDRVKKLPPDVAKAFMASHEVNVALFKARREYHKTTDAAAKAAIVKSMRELLGRQIDSDLIVKAHAIKQLAQRVADLKAELGRRRKNREAIVDEELTKLLKSHGRVRPDAGPGRSGGPREAAPPGKR